MMVNLHFHRGYSLRPQKSNLLINLGIIRIGQKAHVVVTNAVTTDEDTAEPNRTGTRIQPGDTCPVCQQGRMALVETYYRHRAAEDLSVAPPGDDTS